MPATPHHRGPGSLLIACLLSPLCAIAQTEQATGTTPTVAEPLDEYRIELIVFEYGDELAGSAEEWRTPQEILADAAATDDADETGETEPLSVPQPDVEEPDEDEAAVFRFIPLADQELRLMEIRQGLSGSAGYEPLLHVAWQQPGYEREDARPIDLERLGEVPERLRGEATLYRSRFLHLILDLELRDQLSSGFTISILEPGDPADAVAGLEPVVYRLQERRKLKSGELHYYDHPRFGALAKVTPVERAEAGNEPPGPPQPDGEAS